MASPTQWRWVWVNSRSWWSTGRPGVLQSMGSQRVGHDWAIELNWTDQVWGDMFLRLSVILSIFMYVCAVYMTSVKCLFRSSLPIVESNSFHCCCLFYFWGFFLCLVGVFTIQLYKLVLLYLLPGKWSRLHFKCILWSPPMLKIHSNVENRMQFLEETVCTYTHTHLCRCMYRFLCVSELMTSWMALRNRLL